MFQKRLRISRFGKQFAAVVTVFLLAGCVEEKNAYDDGIDEVGAVRLAVTQVPLDVNCIRITTTGATTISERFDVTPGESVKLKIKGLPFGEVAIVGEAFEEACEALTDFSVPNYISAPVSDVITSPSPLVKTLVFTPNGQAKLCVDFEDPAAADYAVRLTSVTIDPEDETGQTTNAPGAWTTNVADPLAQALIIQNGQYLNDGADVGQIKEVDVTLNYGVNTLTVVGTGIFPSNLYYGAVLFFDGQATPPQIAVFNANPSGAENAFSIQPAGTTIMGGANGGLFLDVAPGTAVYEAENGTVVEVLAFYINSSVSETDLISFNQIFPNDEMDTFATLVLNVTPTCP